MVKKFFSVVLLLALVAPFANAASNGTVNTSSTQASSAAASNVAAGASVVTPAVTPVAQLKSPAPTQCISVTDKQYFFIRWAKALYEYCVKQHPYATLSVSGLATVAALYNSESVRNMLGMSNEDMSVAPLNDDERCGCNKPKPNPKVTAE